jgi:hypothetical protein
MLCLSASQDLASKQVDFSNAFVQAELGADEHIYIEVPKGFDYAEGDETMVLKLKRLLYGLVQEPLYWGNHLKDTRIKEGLKQSVTNQCMFIGKDMMLLT